MDCPLIDSGILRFSCAGGIRISLCAVAVTPVFGWAFSSKNGPDASKGDSTNFPSEILAVTLVDDCLLLIR